VKLKFKNEKLNYEQTIKTNISWGCNYTYYTCNLSTISPSKYLSPSNGFDNLQIKRFQDHNKFDKGERKEIDYNSEI
jgi:hypothetical protein